MEKRVRKGQIWQSTRGLVRVIVDHPGIRVQNLKTGIKSRPELSAFFPPYGRKPYYTLVEDPHDPVHRGPEVQPPGE